jgi:hypothetical protein
MESSLDDQEVGAIQSIGSRTHICLVQAVRQALWVSRAQLAGARPVVPPVPGTAARDDNGSSGINRFPLY